MACHYPLFASKDSEGTTFIRGTRGQALEDRFFAGHEYLELDCNRCLACRAKRVRSWAIRSHHESLMHEKSCFLTLTFDNEHLPVDGSLNIEHWQKFARRVRKRLGSFRYLSCGEYGSEEFTARPHYHAAIFGLDFRDGAEPWERGPGRELWLSKDLSELWGQGLATASPLNYATASYVAGYVMKKLKKSDFEAEHRVYSPTADIYCEAKKAEFVTMSRRPGLGSSFLEKYYEEIYEVDEIHIDGKTMPVPRYYDNLLLELDPLLWESVMESRKVRILEKGPSTELELQARRAIFESKRSGETERHASI